MSWINVNEQLPENEEYQKFSVKVRVGSMSPKNTQKIVLGRKYKTGFRFLIGDWETVTHWKPYNGALR